MQGLQKRTYTEDEARLLEEQWREIVKTKTFSPGVVGAGEFRVLNNTGDTPGSYPQIQSLASLVSLSAAELYALQMVEEAAATVVRGGQVLVSIVDGRRPQPEDRLTEFDPTLARIWAVAGLAGG